MYIVIQLYSTKYDRENITVFLKNISGIYLKSNSAVSCQWHGETFIKLSLKYSRDDVMIPEHAIPETTVAYKPRESDVI